MSAKWLHFWRIARRASWILLVTPLLFPAYTFLNAARNEVYLHGSMRDEEHLCDSIKKGLTQTEVEARLSTLSADPPNTCQEVNEWGKQWSLDTTGKNDNCKQFHHMRDYHGRQITLRVYYDARNRVHHTYVLGDP